MLDDDENADAPVEPLNYSFNNVLFSTAPWHNFHI